MPLVTATSSRARMRSLLAASSLAAAAVLGLAGCTSEASPQPGASSGGSATGSATEAPSGSPTPTLEPATPITMSCDELLTPADVAAFNPALVAEADFAPDAASLADAALADDGIACGYTNPESGETLTVALSQPSEVSLTAALNAAVSSSKPVPTYGVPPAVNGFFNPESGEVQVFTPTYWLTATSPMFAEPGDVGELINVALSHLPA